MKVPFGYTAYMYEHDGFHGREWVVEGEMPTDSSMTYKCVNTPAGYGDIISSLKIARTQTMGKPFGHWISYTATEDVSFLLKQGFSSTNEHGTTRENEYKLKVEMKMGFDFELVDVSTKISASYAEEIEQDTRTTTEMDIDKTVQVDCNDKGDTDGVGLWQWVVSSSDEESHVFSVHTICRYGSSYNEPPKCPWNACLDGQCTICASDWME